MTQVKVLVQMPDGERYEVVPAATDHLADDAAQVRWFLGVMLEWTGATWALLIVGAQVRMTLGRPFDWLPTPDERHSAFRQFRAMGQVVDAYRGLLGTIHRTEGRA